MNIIKIDTTALLKNYSNYTLNNNDKNRVKGLLDLIKKYDIRFKYFITISPYTYVPNNDAGKNYITNENRSAMKASIGFVADFLRDLQPKLMGAQDRCPDQVLTDCYRHMANAGVRQRNLGQNVQFC